MQLAGVLQSLVVVAESAHPHLSERTDGFEGDVEVAHQIMGEVVTGQEEEQLVFVERIGWVGDEEDEGGDAVGREMACGSAVDRGGGQGSALPDVTHVEPSAT